MLVGQVDIALGVRGFLPLAVQGDRRIYHRFQALGGNGYRLHNGTAQLGGKSGCINRGLLLCVDVALVQGNYNGNAQLQQLRGEKQAAAEVCGVHNVDDGVGVLMPHIRTGDALL